MIAMKKTMVVSSKLDNHFTPVVYGEEVLSVLLFPAQVLPNDWNEVQHWKKSSPYLKSRNGSGLLPAFQNEPKKENVSLEFSNHRD